VSAAADTPNYSPFQFEGLKLALEGAQRQRDEAQLRCRMLEKEISVQMGLVLEVRVTLHHYKDAVKKLAFDLEMAQGGGRSYVNEAAVRKACLEQAAEHLMDHGVITTGNALVEVCEQIKRLHPSTQVKVKL